MDIRHRKFIRSIPHWGGKRNSHIIIQYNDNMLLFNYPYRMGLKYLRYFLLKDAVRKMESMEYLPRLEVDWIYLTLDTEMSSKH